LRIELETLLDAINPRTAFRRWNHGLGNEIVPGNFLTDTPSQLVATIRRLAAESGHGLEEPLLVRGPERGGVFGCHVLGTWHASLEQFPSAAPTPIAWSHAASDKATRLRLSA
jgi:hypothetical protein